MTHSIHTLRIGLIACLLLPLELGAQNARIVDSLLLGKDIMEVLQQSGPEGNRMTVVQSNDITTLMREQTLENRISAQKIQGFRVRIFFDNKQSARTEAQRIANDFRELYPDVATYVAYENPYFKVTVGDFRTRSEAIRFMNAIKETYPQAFLTREVINFPPL